MVNENWSAHNKQKITCQLYQSNVLARIYQKVFNSLHSSLHMNSEQCDTLSNNQLFLFKLLFIFQKWRNI